MTQRLFYALLMLCSANFCLYAQPDPVKLQQWKDLKYSMFIHYGIYSVLGGVWDNKPIARGLSEQIQAHAGIYSDTYATVAKQFNPIHWNADSIAILAKEAGMRSIVVTSKHHDGFCMFHSAYTDFNVVDATPFKRDIVKELSEACKRNGLKFGIYFSLIDWHYPQASPISSHNSDYITPEHFEYNKKQVTELLTNYGAISELWFDMGSQSAAQSKELSELVHKLQPDCQVSSRIGNDRGDFTVMGDNQEPDYSIGVPWQSPASFFDETWGYRSWQKRGEEKDKAKEKLTSLIRVVSRGGNYLLNIGPKGDGSVVDFEKHVLLDIGNWLKKNGEAIYGTQPDPFRVSFDWGNVTTSGKKMYLLVRSAPKDNKIVLPGLKGKIEKTYVLSDKTACRVSVNATDIEVQLPKDFSVADEFKVIAIEFKNGFTVAPVNVITENNNKISVDTDNAYKYYSSSCIDYNTRFRSTVKESWTITSQAGGMYSPTFYYSDEEKGKEIDLTINEVSQVVRFEGGETIQLKNQSVQWGPAYLAGPFWSGLEGAHGKTSDIDLNTSWPDAGGTRWKQLTDWQKNKPYTLPEGAETAYYVLQEITSPVDESLLIDVMGSDGVVVFVNGKEELIHLNPDKEKTAQYVLLVELRKGKNQVLVKLFNHFRKNIICSIGEHPQQVLYRKQLSPLKLESAKTYPVSWRLHLPVTPHQTLLLPNLSLELVKMGKN